MYDFREKEKKILDFWKEHNIFEKSLSLREKAKRFVFFDGPPTANGRPGIHHFLGRSFKDLFCRYKTMRGFFVLRKAGWDTHGLPVELQIEKELGFKNKRDIEEYGIAPFNQKAKESVWVYKKEWEEMTERMGFWLDTKNPYITYESPYVESVWSIVKEISDKNLLFKAHKVVPFCTRCGTPLSSHEVAQGYQTVTDRSVYIKFKLTKGQKIGGHLMGDNTYILAWTTTPWTLPGNVALAIGKDIDYSLVKIDKDYILVASELSEKVLGTLEAVSHHKGSDLVGLSYEPLFKIKELQSDKSYKMYDASFVSTTDGTGVVHTAVMYGEDDYNLGTQLELPKFHTVNELGKFVGVSSDLDGKYVKAKETEDLIIQHLTDNHNLLKTEDYEHEYPFCWRCNSPLLYYAKSSWFIKTTAVKDQMIASNNEVNWVPEHLKDGRMGQWLKDIKDWSISRERYWGTPLPVWECSQCDHRRVVGSFHELEKASISKKNSYYLMRHSFSGRNEKEDVILNSRIESDIYHLTDDAKKIVHEVADGLKNEDIDLIFTSPFRRTKETAQIIGKTLHVEVVEDERLREVGHSLECEGKPRSLCAIKDQKYNPFRDNGHDHENWHHLRKRLQSFMNEMEEKYSKKKILIVSHGDPLKVLSYIGQGFSEKEVLDAESKEDNWYPRPAGLYHLKWRNIPRNEEGELDPHRPFIDRVAFKCTECKATMKKIPDLMDVWFDSGAMPFAQWHWPFENKKIQKEQYPAEFITEAIDQTRGWFYTMLAVGTLLDRPVPYKNVLCYSHVLDEKGKKMSKSKGNIVFPFDVMDKTGADAARWYFYTINSPAESKLFSMKDVELKLRSFIWTLNNCMRFLSLYSSQEIGNDYTPKTLLDKWIFSRLNHLIADVSTRLDAYDSMGAARAIDAFVVEDISNWWLRRSRKRKEALPILKYLLLDISRLLAPFTPFIAEEIYLSLNGHELFNQPSVHLTDWPKASKRLMNLELESSMATVRDMVTRGLALRKEKQLKVRQPLRSATLKLIVKFKGDLEDLLKDELNVKKILYSKDATTDVELNTELDAELVAEGYAREFIRQLQDARKEAGYQVSDEANVAWHSEDPQIASAITHWADTIKKDVVLKDFTQRRDSKTFDVEKESDLAPGKKIWFGIIK